MPIYRVMNADAVHLCLSGAMGGDRRRRRWQGFPPLCGDRRQRSERENERQQKPAHARLPGIGLMVDPTIHFRVTTRSVVSAPGWIGRSRWFPRTDRYGLVLA